MHDDTQKTTQIEPTGDVILATPGQKPPEPRLQEVDRAQLNELWQEARAAHNALVALQTEQKRLDAERRVVEADARTQVVLGQQLDAKVQAKLSEIMQRYNIPEGWTVDAKTGLVTEPTDKPTE